VSKTNKLILKDKVFGLAGSLGTATHLAVLKSINPGKRGIPDLFVSTGYSGFDNPKKYPTTFTYLPSYVMEGKIVGKLLASKFPGKKIAILYQDDDYGRDGLAGFKSAGTTFVSSKGYASGSQSSPGLGAQLTAFKAAGAEVVVLFGVTSANGIAIATAAKLGFAPQWILGSVGGDATTLKALGIPFQLLNGAMGASFLPSTSDDKDPYVAKFKEINDKYNKGKDKTWDNNVLVGMNMAMTLVTALRAAGKDLTRAGLVKALEAKGGSFATAGLVPLGYSATSHAGYTGYWFGAYDAAGNLVPDGGKYTIYTTDSGSGAVVTSTYVRPAMPANAIPNN
jgi:ABC-type branched-subunit amino acid transport system substrate-binding protein